MRKLPTVSVCFRWVTSRHYRLMSGIKRIFETLYLRRRATPREIREFAHTYFGEGVGYAQQYLFHYVHECSNWADAEHLSLLEASVVAKVEKCEMPTRELG